MKSNVEWKHWGEKDPLFAVSSWPGKEKSAPDAWTADEFYAHGASDWPDFLTHWKRYGVELGHCVEIGCGAGRMTSQLVRDFRKVTAFDVSGHQIDYAREHISQPNVTFVVTDGVALPLPEQSAQAVFSCHVLQHFDTREDALRVLGEAHRVLVPGGTILVHLPVVKVPRVGGSGLVLGILRILERMRTWRDALRRRRGQLFMRTQCYESDWLFSTLQSLGFDRVELQTFAVGSKGHLHDVVLATRAASRRD